MLLYETNERTKQSERNEKKYKCRHLAIWNGMSTLRTNTQHTQRRVEERRGKKYIKFSVLRSELLTLVCFMGHKLLAFRLRTAIFTRLFSLVELRLRSLCSLCCWAPSKKCFYMKNWNLYFIFHHEKYCWMDFYKYACFCCLFSLLCSLSHSPACAPLLPQRAPTTLALFFLDCAHPLSSLPTAWPDWFIPTRRRRRLYDGSQQ